MAFGAAERVLRIAHRRRERVADELVSPFEQFDPGLVALVLFAQREGRLVEPQDARRVFGRIEPAERAVARLAAIRVGRLAPLHAQPELVDRRHEHLFLKLAIRLHVEPLQLALGQRQPDAAPPLRAGHRELPLDLDLHPDRQVVLIVAAVRGRLRFRHAGSLATRQRWSGQLHAIERDQMVRRALASQEPAVSHDAPPRALREALQDERLEIMTPVRYLACFIIGRLGRDLIGVDLERAAPWALPEDGRDVGSADARATCNQPNFPVMSAGAGPLAVVGERCGCTTCSHACLAIAKARPRAHVSRLYRSQTLIGSPSRVARDDSTRSLDRFERWHFGPVRVARGRRAHISHRARRRCINQRDSRWLMRIVAAMVRSIAATGSPATRARRFPFHDLDRASIVCR
jgi:hypothetical protein